MEVAKGEKTFQTGVVVFPTSSRVNCRKYEFNTSSTVTAPAQAGHSRRTWLT